MDWEKLKNPASVIGSLALLGILYSGNQLAKIPDRIAEIESNQRVLIWRMEQLEIAVHRDSKAVAIK